MIYNLCYSDKTGIPHIIFNNIDCYFKKDGNSNFLVFCNNDKNKAMINNYVAIIFLKNFLVLMNLKIKTLFLLVILQDLNLKLMII